MAKAEPGQRSIHQTGGDGAMQVGENYGIINIGIPTPQTELSLDFDAYSEHQRSQLAIWERQYTRLDVDPAVALAGQDLRPVPDSRLALTEAFIRHKRLIVVGGAGAGKTTSMLYLVASVLPGGALAGRLQDFIPIYIGLGRFRDYASTSPLGNLLLLIAETLALGKPLPEETARQAAFQLLTTHRVLFLLDALNEIRSELRASCLAAIEDLEKLNPDSRVVLSSRSHGFSPPQGWEVVLLRELEDKQICEFAERYSRNEVRETILEVVAHNPLLRIPLFLDLALKMGSSPHPVDQRLLRSRSGLVKAYVKSLLFRGLSSSESVLSLDRLRTALDRLAQATQATGQVLSLSEARHAVEIDTSCQPAEAQQILGDLCERGFLTTDGQNLRFWHQTIQEYFYAGSIVRRWRGSKKRIGRMPRWLRRLAVRPEEEEALSFMVAHLGDGEVEGALRSGLRGNPALAISWADDLSLEGRAVQATERFTARVHRFALAACQYSWFGKGRGEILVNLGLVCSFLLMFPLLVSLQSVLVFMGVEAKFAARLLLPWGFAAECFLLLDTWRRRPLEKLESILGRILEIRDPTLHKAFGALAQEISQLRLIRRDIRALAQGVSRMDAVNGEDLIKWLRTSHSPYTMTQLIGHLDTPFAVPLFAELLKLNNCLSLAALDALVARANRLRNERQEVKDLLWEVWKNGEMDNLIRQRARKLLLRAGEQPGGRGDQVRYFILRSLQALTVAFCLAIIAVSLPTKILLVLAVGISALVWWDARKIGARKIPGHPRLDEAPWEWALGTLVLPFLMIPKYLLNHQRIRQEATPVDWDAILRAVKAAAPHGDSRSITHPPPPTGSAGGR